MMKEMGNMSKKQRKEAGKALKRKRIEEAGGVRPRKGGAVSKGAPTSKLFVKESQNAAKSSSASHKGKTSQDNHAMSEVSSSTQEKPRLYTLSIAVPGSVVSNCQTRELKTLLVGQIARAATIYQVDEIVVYDDNLSVSPTKRGSHKNRQHRDDTRKNKHDNHQQHDDHNQPSPTSSASKNDPHTFMARLLQYCECPQYLRQHFFPVHSDLRLAGLLAPIDAPHHYRAHDRSTYREGVVLDKPKGPHGGSFVNVGLRTFSVEVDRLITPGVRCTVRMNHYGGPNKKPMGQVVSPAAPRENSGIYWGYSTRIASSLKRVFDECPYPEGYDFKIGTSQRGNVTVDDTKFALPAFKHLIVVFGGVAGIEECVDADETLSVSGADSHKLFDMWLNTCPSQGSRTIRTEEAVLLSLARLRPHVANNSQHQQPQQKHELTSDVVLSDGDLSEESSEESSDDSSESS